MGRRRRAHISTYVPTRVAEDLDDAADHYGISLSEIVNRVLSKAAREGFPTDAATFFSKYPKCDSNEDFDAPLPQTKAKPKAKAA